MRRLLPGLAMALASASIARLAGAQEGYDREHGPPGFGRPPAAETEWGRDEQSSAYSEGTFEDRSSGRQEFDSRPRGEFGGYFMLVPGIAGQLSNGGVAVSTGAEVAIGGKVRYHAAVGFMHMGSLAHGFGAYSNTTCDVNNWNACSTVTAYRKPGTDGVALEAATLGFPIPLYQGAVGIAIEPLIDLLEWSFLYGDRVTMTWQSGFGVQAVLNYKRFFVAVRPFDVQFRYLVFSDAFEPGIGVDWPVRTAAGLRF